MKQHEMGDTFSQIYHQFVFAVKGRRNLIRKEWEHELYRYIGGVIRKEGHKLYIINGMPDHIHILVSMDPRYNPSDLLRSIKANSSRWVNQRGLVKGRFQWQGGGGIFTYHQSMVPTVVNYILRQKEHHGRRTFREEFIKLLEGFEVEYDERYLPEFYDELYRRDPNNSG